MGHRSSDAQDGDWWPSGSTQAAGAVQRLLEHWRSRGGELQYGTSANASCAPIVN
ncbi:hypothetical protein [Nonomuraea bangladeshensis]|uniref:hypothetical protein n=1 Tax=Nonomuraea bangladeshensis TaxID=404385 RepID=UPI003C2C4902